MGAKQMDKNVEAATLLLSVVGEMRESDDRRLGLLSLAAGYLAKDLLLRESNKLFRDGNEHFNRGRPKEPVTNGHNKSNAHPHHVWTEKDVGLCRRLYLRK